MWHITGTYGGPNRAERPVPSALAEAAAAQARVSQIGHGSPEAQAHAWGAMLQREHPRDWPRLIGIAAGAAIAADHGEGG